jgi:hypothetical protein
MEHAYRNISYLFVAVLLIIFVGFYKTYFGLIPNVSHWAGVIHFHAVVLLLWFGMLIAQPLLIRAKQFRLHRTLGRVSYGLVPIVLVSMWLASRSQFVRFVGQIPDHQNLADLFIPLSQMLLFGILYVLAMVYRRQIPAHLRFVVASSVVFLSPSLGRVPWDGVMFSWTSIFISFMIPDLVLLALLLFDVKNGKNPRPYLISLALLLASHVGWLLLPDSAMWQTTAQEIVRFF